MTIDAIVRSLSHVRLPLDDEKRLQAAIESELIAGALDPQREVDLGNGDIVDFMVGSIAIEVKVKGQRRAIYRQCERYCAHEQVSALLLVTNVAMGFPAELKGKPVAVLNLGRAWL